MERFRRRSEETAAVTAMQLSKIDTTQEDGSVQQQETEKKSATPNFSQGETSSKKLQLMN